MQLSEREDNHNGPADEGLDTEWVIEMMPLKVLRRKHGDNKK